MAKPLIHHLGAVLRAAREEAGLSRRDLSKMSDAYFPAATSKGVDGVSENTLVRTENAKNKSQWPRNPEALVDLYADATKQTSLALWRRAIKRWELDSE